MLKDKKIFILVALIPIMIFVWMRSCSIVSSKAKPKPAVASKPSVENIPIPRPAQTIESKTRPRTQYKEWGRSPFVLAKAKKYVSDLMLAGILWDKENPRAIINNRIVGLGDELEGYKVIEIKKDRVILSDGINKAELRL